MRLPDDEHAGWDRLIQAVVDHDDQRDEQATDDHVTTPDLLATLDLVALQARAGAVVGDGDRRSTI